MIYGWAEPRPAGARGLRRANAIRGLRRANAISRGLRRAIKSHSCVVCVRVISISLRLVITPYAEHLAHAEACGGHNKTKPMLLAS